MEQGISCLCGISCLHGATYCASTDHESKVCVACLSVCQHSFITSSSVTGVVLFLTAAVSLNVQFCCIPALTRDRQFISIQFQNKPD